MVGFGYKTAWLAIRDGDADRAFAAVGAGSRSKRSTGAPGSIEATSTTI
jgi:hypothetical protein